MAFDLPPVDVPALIRQCAPNVAVETFQPLINVESAKRPHAIGYKVVARDGTIYRLTSQPKDTAEAKQWATWFLNNGYSFDAGIAQVNTVNFNSTGLTPDTMFDPCHNIRAGAQILTQCYKRAYTKYGHEQDALKAALSCYQSGNFRTGFSTGYVNKIIAAAGGSQDSVLPPLPLMREGQSKSKNVQGSQGKVPVTKSELHTVSSEVPGWNPSDKTQEQTFDLNKENENP